jgi:hypothetical protein
MFMSCEPLSCIVKSVNVGVTVLVALLTFIFGLFEYKRQGSQKRANFFILMRERMYKNKVFIKICDLLDKEDASFDGIDYWNKRDFLGFFEELALMVNSNIIKKDVAHYMFGYYVIRCWQNDKFWTGTGIDRQSFYWGLFKKFAMDMKEIEDNKLRPRKMFKKSDYRF